jgi:hypothetical protein
MSTPVVNAAKGFHPTEVSSLKRVVKPIDKKVKINAQVLSPLTGFIIEESTVFAVAASTEERYIHI